MTTPLADQQQALLQALWQPRHQDAVDTAASCAAPSPAPARPQWERGLQALRSNARELAQRALAAAYPVVAELLGAENFEPLARQLWHRHPPASGDLAQWGANLAALITSVPELAQQEPYLPDVARLEWALHRAAFAADARPDAASFGLLAERDPSQLMLVLGPGVSCLTSDYPVVSIVNAHLEGEPALEEAGRLLREQAAETAVVWREGLKPRVRKAQAGEAAFIAALQENRSLFDSLSAAPGLDIDGWLAPAVHSGLLARVRAL